MKPVTKVPFFDLHRLYLEQKTEIEGAVAEVLQSGHYILGKQGSAFEQELKDYLVGKSGEGAVVGCNSGTDALILSMLASGIGFGDEVIAPSLTAIPTITAIKSVGAIPVFCEIHPQTWVLDTSKIEALLTPKTKAIVLVHLYGNMVNVTEVERLLARLGRKDIVVIEDVAQALGAALLGKKAGTLGRFGAYSFYPTKNIGALGDAGAVFAKNAEDASRLRWVRNYGQIDRYNAEVPRGTNSRLDEVQAAVLRVRLKKLNAWNRAKDQMVEKYTSAVKGLPLQTQQVTAGCKPGWHLFVLAAESEPERNRYMGELESKGIQTLIHYPIPCHLQKAFLTKTLLPVTEKICSQIFSAPMNSSVTRDELDRVCEALISISNSA